MPQYKCVGLPGSGGGDPNHLNAYRFRDGQSDSVRNDLLSSGTSWVRMFCYWHLLQPKRPAASWQASWASFNRSPIIRQLDQEIARARPDMGIILAVSPEFPLWANGLEEAVRNGQKTPRSPYWKYAWNLSPNGYFGWFIGYLVARYKQAAVNPTGPRPANAGEDSSRTLFGNPSGAWVNAIDVVNEPNQLFWPQSVENGDTAALAAAVIMNTGEAYSEAYNHADSLSRPSPAILGPGNTDYPTNTTFGYDNPAVEYRGKLATTNTYTFSDLVEGHLRDLKWGGVATVPRIYVGWSIHCYNDVKNGITTGPGPSGQTQGYRTQLSFGIVKRKGWYDPANVWLTEGGYPTADDNAQASRIQDTFNKMKSTYLPEAYLWTQWTVNNKATESRKYGWRRDVSASGVPGSRRPLYYTWSALSES